MMIRLGGGSWPWEYSWDSYSSHRSYGSSKGGLMAPPTLSLGQIAFQAYAEAQGGLTYDKKKIPTWDKIGADIQAAWEAAAVAAVNASTTLSNHARRDILGG